MQIVVIKNFRQKMPNRCGYCRKPGHNKKNCPLLRPDLQAHHIKSQEVDDVPYFSSLDAMQKYYQCSDLAYKQYGLESHDFVIHNEEMDIYVSFKLWDRKFGYFKGKNIIIQRVRVSDAFRRRGIFANTLLKLLMIFQPSTLIIEGVQTKEMDSWCVKRNLKPRDGCFYATDVQGLIIKLQERVKRRK